MEAIKRTERGWGGHFCLANRCRFRRNTLLERGGIGIVISTVGLMEARNGEGFETIGHNRHYETMVFYADMDDRFKDADVLRQVSFDSNWCISELDAEDAANDMHEAVVDEIASRRELFSAQ